MKTQQTPTKNLHNASYNSEPNNPAIVLASSSPYRAKLLGQLGLVFEQLSPDINENPHPDEVPEVLAKRLSAEKAQKVHSTMPEYIVIASDQVASIEGSNYILNKPQTMSKAEEQLSACSGKTVHFYTGLAVLAPPQLAHRQKCNALQVCVERYSVTFRKLSETQIRSYINRENPLNCAGSFKVEGLGIALFSHMDGRDYNALIGLPLIALTDALNRLGIDVLTMASQA
uniref:Maf family protein n=1 Tax=Ningiella ruwaisensis TaxID=2364274 RepID=UPI00109FAF4E|nr:Maf family protein [Ningiella ruwaisensis]